MPITKDMVAPNSQWAKVRDSFERAYDMFAREQFLDYITTAYIVHVAELELEISKPSGLGYSLES